jgi:release factor glutamine methyltransferase
MIPTPDLSHLTRHDLEQVYDPAEDTFLLLDALEQDAEALRKEQPLICLEVGSGSGCVSAFLGKIFGPSSSLYLCTDINKHATRCTLATGKQNK